MDLPELSHEEYDKLVEFDRQGQDEGYELDTYWIQPLNPMVLYKDNWQETPKLGLRVQFLNVAKPHLYRRKQFVFIIYPIGDLTYDSINAIFPKLHPGNPFGFVLKESWYDDMDECNYYFLTGDESHDGRVALPKFDLKEVWTH
jgi:hypothetical protein